MLSIKTMLKAARLLRHRESYMPPIRIVPREGEERAKYVMKLQTDLETGERNYVQVMAG